MGPWRRGSASRSQREGRGSESRRLHQTVPPVARLTRHPCGQTLIMHWKKRWEGPSRPDFFPARAGVFPGRRFESGSGLSGGVRDACRPEDRAARRAASWTPPFASVVQWQARRSPKPSIRVRVPAGVRRRHPPFWPIGASAPGEDGDGFGMWRSWQRARLGAARPRVRVPPFRRGKTQQDRACPHEGEIRRAPPQTAWRKSIFSPRRISLDMTNSYDDEDGAIPLSGLDRDRVWREWGIDLLIGAGVLMGRMLP